MNNYEQPEEPEERVPEYDPRTSGHVTADSSPGKKTSFASQSRKPKRPADDSLNWKHELQLLQKSDVLQSLNRDLEESRLMSANI